MQRPTPSRQAGFTLVEMSVVLVIIGLIAAGILSGRAIIEASETRAVMSEIRQHMQSFALFVDRYRAYPGDYRNADTAFDIASSFNGDGNNQIVWADEEGAKAWYHLQLAGFTDGNFTGTGTDGVPGTNVPVSTIGGGGVGYFFDYDSGDLQNHIGIGFRNTAGGINSEPALTPMRANDIDRKLDDGRPSDGYIQSTGADCIAGSAYNTADEDAREAYACLLMARIDE